MNFIINTLLLWAPSQGKSFEQQLISMIDKGCDGYSLSNSNMSIGQSSNSTLSTYCLSNLFDLCSGNVDKSLEREIIEIKTKIAKTTIPILVNRCKETLKKFLSDEKKASIMINQNRIDEVVFILKKLVQLEVYSELIPGLI
jgi:hypothetical protein